MTRVPDPTDVIPTMNPIDAPIARVGAFLTFSVDFGAADPPGPTVEEHLQPERCDGHEQHRAEREADDALNARPAADRFEEYDAEEG